MKKSKIKQQWYCSKKPQTKARSENRITANSSIELIIQNLSHFFVQNKYFFFESDGKLPQVQHLTFVFCIRKKLLHRMLIIYWHLLRLSTSNISECKTKYDGFCVLLFSYIYYSVPRFPFMDRAYSQ